MESDIKQRTQKNKRRERAVRMQMQKDQERSEQLSEEDDCGDGQIRQIQRPPIRKKRNKEPLYEEDVIDGFSILSFKTYEDLENTVNGVTGAARRRKPPSKSNRDKHLFISNHHLINNVSSQEKKKHHHHHHHHHKHHHHHQDRRSRSASPPAPLPPINGRRSSSPNIVSENNILDGTNTVNNNTTSADIPTPPPSPQAPSLPVSDPRPKIEAEEAEARPNTPPEVNGIKEPLSEASSPASSVGGYMCDAESEDDKVSDGGSDLFKASSTTVPTPPLKRELPLSVYNYRSPSPLHNGHLDLDGSEPPLPSVNSFLSPKSNFLTKAEPQAPPPPPRCSPPPLSSNTNSNSIAASATAITINTSSSCSSSKCYDNVVGPLNFVAQPPPTIPYPLKASPVTPPVSTPVAASTAPSPPVTTSSASASISLISPEHHLHHSLHLHPSLASQPPQQHHLQQPLPSSGSKPPHVLVNCSRYSTPPEQQRLRCTPPKPPYLHSPIPPSPTKHPSPLHLPPSRGDSSNSSLSSLSQLSHSLQATPSKPGAPRSRSSSRNTTPLSGPPLSLPSSSAAYGSNSSSVVFAKNNWLSSPSANPLLSGSVHSRAAPPPPPVLPLPATLHTGTSSHYGLGSSMFASPLPATAPASATDPLFTSASNLMKISHTGKDQDLLRRELDTRFLASQDRSISIPPPPYLRSTSSSAAGSGPAAPDMHHHHHQPTPASFLTPPSLGPAPGSAAALPPTPPSHLYEKFPKVDASPFYARSALSLGGYPGLSPLLPPTAGAPPTPFVSPNHLAAFQPKIGNLVKSKTTKSGKWCAMHVRIAWEIYHHQQKQHHSGGGPSAADKKSSDLLRQPMFPPPPRPGDLPPPPPTFSTHPSLLTPPGAHHARLGFESPAVHHGSFLSPHLGLSPFARPGFPAPGFTASSYSGLGSLGLPGIGGGGSAGLFGATAGAQDPWSRLHAPTFSPSAAAAAPWGGLKAEAERDQRLKAAEQHRKAELERREKEEKAKELAAREKLREQERLQQQQKERDREARLYHHHHLNSSSSTFDSGGGGSSSICNGDLDNRTSGREQLDLKPREKSRSPLRTTTSHHHLKNGSAFESTPPLSSATLKVKEEKKESPHPTPPDKHKESVLRGTEDLLQRSSQPSLSMLERTRMLGAAPTFWGPLPPNDHPALRDLADRDMQRYLSMLPPYPPSSDRLREAAELSRHQQDRQLAMAASLERSKVYSLPPRFAEPAYAHPAAVASGFPPTFFPPTSPYLSSLTAKSKPSPNPPPLIPSAAPSIHSQPR